MINVTNNLITMKKILFFLWCFGALFCWHECFADITLAIIAPKAGANVKAGDELFEGARLAVKELNDDGGINGEKLDMLTIDDQCDDRLAVSTAEMLSLLNSKKIGLVVGPYCSNQFNQVADLYEKSKIFQIIPTTEAYHSGSVAKKGRIVLLGTKTQMSKDFFQFYNQNFAGLKVGFVYEGQDETGYGDVAKVLYDEFRRYGKSELLKFYMLNENKSNVFDVADTVIKDNIPLVFALGDSDDVFSLVRRLRRKDENKIIFTSKKMLSQKKLGELNKLADGVYLLDLPGLKDSLMFTESLVNLRLLGVEPEGLETYSYVAVKLWGDLAKSVKSFDYNKLVKASNSAELQQKWGEFLMHSGRVNAAKYIIEQYKDGSFKQVY